MRIMKNSKILNLIDYVICIARELVIYGVHYGLLECQILRNILLIYYKNTIRHIPQKHIKKTNHLRHFDAITLRLPFKKIVE
uniref:Bm13384 n=1 Tax=Brugia malayi TaxID=6279 RepID=A0A1I9G0D8_BRUMA|nr:Bm13384 [Brugia malayi]